MALTNEELFTSFRKGKRNGNWRKLSQLETALYRASLWYSRVQGPLINVMLVNKLAAIAAKLKEGKGTRILKHGYEKAVVLLDNGESIFAWAPRMRVWLKDPDYVFWLGAGGMRIVKCKL